MLTTAGPIDLATAEPVIIRRLPPCDAPDEQRWSAACSRLAALWHEDMPCLVDHGVTGQERFEAYELRPAATHALASVAVTAFLNDAGLADVDPAASTQYEDVPRIGLRLLPRDALRLIQELLDDGRAGRPRCVVCAGEPGAGTTTLLRLAAAEGRRRGYVPISARAIQRWPGLITALRDRHALLLCDVGVASGTGERCLLGLARVSDAGHVLVRVGREANACTDAVLHLERFDPQALARSLHMYPPDSLTERRVHQTAVRSGGLPGPFVRALRAGDRLRPAVRAGLRSPGHLRVAEARAAYAPDPGDRGDREVEHPWSDMLARAERLADSGRRAAAERELRDIAGAASRRQLTAVSHAAKTRLAVLLANRGQLDAAERVFSSAGPIHHGDDRQAIAETLGLAMVKIERGAFEAAESMLRAARTIELTRPSLALAECLAWQARYSELERCLAALPPGADPVVRGRVDVLLARAALARADLPRAARLASGALQVLGDAVGDIAVVNAHEILALVHGEVADLDAVRRHARAALVEARRRGLVARIPRLRSSMYEALHAAGVTPARRELERLLAVAPRMTPLSRACVWKMAARLHPVSRQRDSYRDHVKSFVAASGAVSLERAADPPPDGHAEAVAGLVQLQEAITDDRALLRGIADWLLHRLEARSVQIVTADGERVASAGTGETVQAAVRVLVTRTSQPPWGNGALEAAVLIRAGARVAGTLGVRWPAAHQPERNALSLISTAAAFAAPALAVIGDPAVPQTPRPDSHGIVGRSAAISRLRDAVARAAPSPFPVLIEGESGCGKELVARAIHAASHRRHRACVAVNCAAFGDDLLEAELFGHVRGAFTGAHIDRPGLFEQADGGTLFLDEVSELSPRAQAKLLRALQDGEVRRIGENTTRRVDVRIVAASNRRLHNDVEQGRFRKDLLFRLAVVRIGVPPLRERREDIPLLAAHYWQRAAERTRSRASLSTAAVAALSRYDWPGNVRELQNVMAALAVHAARGRIGVDAVSPLLAGESHASAQAPRGTLEEARRRFDREYVTDALARCGGRHAAAARDLGVTRQGLAKLLRRLSMEDRQ